MIAFPRTTIPVPEAVAALSARQLPDRVRAARRQAWEASVRLDLCRQPRYEEGRQRALAELSAANKVLAAVNPGLIFGWGDMPGQNR
ncbi:hypothetical protein OHV08_34095 [Streptomyces canus]|uniref:hypothetical protein n=1 Tax=Streptomyces canus TaxID=58343 RepID=UPI00324F1CBD